MLNRIRRPIPTTTSKMPLTGPRYRIDLSGHIAECDANYVRLMKLLPDLYATDERAIGLDLLTGSTLVRLCVIERCPYTTTVRLQQGSPSEAMFRAPAMTVRLYHDARTAEVTEYQNERGFQPFYTYPNLGMRLPDEKAQINKLLSELLSFYLLTGTSTQSVSLGNP